MDQVFHGIEKLCGEENWCTWKFAVRSLLRGTEGAFEVCTGELEKPVPLLPSAERDHVTTYNTALKKWDKADRAASNLLVKTVESKIIALLVSCESAREMWLKLHAIFEQSTKQTSHTVLAEFYNFRMCAGDSIITHIAKFEGIVLRMKQLSVAPDESSQVVKMLDTLPDSFDALRQAWWARAETEQTFSKLVALLTSEEKSRLQRKQRTDDMAALVAATTRVKVSEAPRSGAGSSDSGSSKQSTSKKNKGRGPRCFSCKQLGHVRSMCPNENKGMSEMKNDIVHALNAQVCDVSNKCDTWLLDSGATCHIARNRQWFTSYQVFDTPVKVHIGKVETSMDAVGKGDIECEALINGKWLTRRLENVLHVPTSRNNLFSQTSTLDKGMLLNSSSKECKFTKAGEVMVRGARQGSFFRMLLRMVQSKITDVCKVNVAKSETIGVCEANMAELETTGVCEANVTNRLGHRNKQDEQFLEMRGISVLEEDSVCAAGLQGKQQHSSYKSRSKREKRPGETMRAEMCGPMEVDSIGGVRYFLCLTCDYTRYRIVVFLKEKSETAIKVVEALKLFVNLCGRPVDVLYCDGRLEFHNSIVKSCLQVLGTQVVLTNQYSATQNENAERTSRTIMESACTMLMARNLPRFLWMKAVDTAVYVYNRTGPSNVIGKTSYEAFTGKRAKLESQRAEGTLILLQDKGEAVAAARREALSGIAVKKEREKVDDVESFGSTEETLQDADRSLLNESSSRVAPDTPRNLCNRDLLKQPDRLTVVMVAEVDDDINYRDAIESGRAKHWHGAIKEETALLMENLTWSLVKLQKGRKTVSNRRVSHKLKQSSRCWKAKFKEVLLQFGLSENKADPCLYTRMDNGRKLLVVWYLDDGLDAASKKQDIEALLRCLDEKFKITCRTLECFLSVNTTGRQDGLIFINQMAFAEEVLLRSCIADMKSVVTPIEQYLQECEIERAEPSFATYRVIGSLMDVAIATRPDITFSVSYLSQFLEQPSEQLWSKVKSIFRCVRSTTDLGIEYRADSEAGLSYVYSDADYTSGLVIRRSVSGIVSLHSGGAVSWASQRRKCVCLSTTEPKYIVASEAANEAVRLSRMK